MSVTSDEASTVPRPCSRRSAASSTEVIGCFARPPRSCPTLMFVPPWWPRYSSRHITWDDLLPPLPERISKLRHPSLCLDGCTEATGGQACEMSDLGGGGQLAYTLLMRRQGD